MTQDCVLGIDASTKTGYSVVGLRSGEVYDSGVIKSKTLKGFARSWAISESMVDVMETYDIVLAVVEGHAYNVKTRHVFKLLVEITTVIKCGLYEKGIPWVDIPPAVLKKYVTGKGNAGKDAMLRGVADNWGVITKFDDIADAVGLAYLGRCLLGLDHYKKDFVGGLDIDLPYIVQNV